MDIIRAKAKDMEFQYVEDMAIFQGNIEANWKLCFKCLNFEWDGDSNPTCAKWPYQSKGRKKYCKAFLQRKEGEI